MSKKLSGNGIYEGSRMIMPEHREAFLAQEREQQRRGKPVLDDQAIEEITRALAESYNEKVRVDLVVFNPFYDEPVSGVVTGIDNQTNRVKLMLNEEIRWVSLAEIMSAIV